MSFKVQEIETFLHTRRSFNVTETNAFPDFTASVDCKKEFPRFFHPVYTEERISIPTVHVIGSDESSAVKRLAEIAKALCEREKVIAVMHRGAHEIPHKTEGVEAVARAIEKANFMGQRIG
jgi:hypothetical protein